MRLRIALLAVVLAGSFAGTQPSPKGNQVTELAGRKAGKTQRCVSLPSGRLFSVSESDPHLVLYDDGTTIWASNIGPSCSFEGGQTVIPDETASYYCKGDFVRAGSRITLPPFGRRCALGNFTPYRATK